MLLDIMVDLYRAVVHLTFECLILKYSRSSQRVVKWWRGHSFLHLLLWCPSSCIDGNNRSSAMVEWYSFLNKGSLAQTADQFSISCYFLVALDWMHHLRFLAYRRLFQCHMFGFLSSFARFSRCLSSGDLVHVSSWRSQPTLAWSLPRISCWALSTFFAALSCGASSPASPSWADSDYRFWCILLCFTGASIVPTL